jgi:radical SAM protein with 4Fe4S-binding SPASM domain
MSELLKESIIPYVDQHYWLPLYSMGSLATAKEKELGLEPIAGNTGRFDSPVAPIPCWTLFTETHIMSDGRMSACCADATGEWTMGDLTKIPFIEAWHSKEFQELRKAHLDNNIIGTKCEHCIIYK